MMLLSMLETVKLFLDATKAYAQMAYMAQKGHAKLAFTNSFSELDVSNLEISKLDISKIFSYRFCNPVSMDIVLMVKVRPWLGVCSMHPHQV